MPRLRFSLRSLLLLALFAGSVMLIRYALRWGPWSPGISFDEGGTFEEFGFSPDDSRIYSITAQSAATPAAPPSRTLTLRAAHTGRVLQRLALPPGYGFFKFSPGGRYFSLSNTTHVAGPFDCTNGLMWRASDGAAISLAPFSESKFFSLYHSPGDAWALVATPEFVRLVSMPDLKTVHELKSGLKTDDFCFSENDKHFAWTQHDRAFVYSFESKTVRTLQRDHALFKHAALSPDGSMLALCNYNYPRMLIEILDWKANKVLDQFEGRFITIEKGHFDSVSGPFSPDGKQFKFGGQAGGSYMRTIGIETQDLMADAPLPRTVTQRIGGVDISFNTLNLVQSPDRTLFFSWSAKDPYIGFVKTGEKLFEFDSSHWRRVLPGARMYCRFAHRGESFVTQVPYPDNETKSRLVAWNLRMPRDRWNSPWSWVFLPESWLAAALGLAAFASIWRDQKSIYRARKSRAPSVPSLSPANPVE